MTYESPLNKIWTLLRYVAEVNHHSPFSSPNSSLSNEQQSIQRQTIDCTDGILVLKFTTNQQLCVIRDETDKIECIDLLSIDSSSFIARYTDDCILISYVIPSNYIQRKFLIKFASTSNQNSRQNCEECVKYFSRFVNITKFDSTSKIETTIKSDSMLSIFEMINILLGENSTTLSTYYNQDVPFDINRSNEYLEKYLCDESFPDFVATVASILNSMKDKQK